MTGALTIGAAFVLGVTASGHCLVMCGGISAALGVATERRTDGRPKPILMIGYQVGRIASYALAGLLFGSVVGGVIGWLDIEAVRRSLRALSALALLLASLITFGAIRDPSFAIGRQLWSKLAPLSRKLLPVNRLSRAIAFGMLWGWMPCGFVYTVLLMAALQGNGPQSGATMMAFGMGTAPAMFATAIAARRFVAAGASPAGRRIAGSLLLVGAVLTLAGPWLLASSPWLHAHVPFDCNVDR